MRDGRPVTGDKFTTFHGQKGVITILDDNDMPSVKGKHDAEFVKGSSSIIKRDTMSQVLEACYTQWLIEHQNYLSLGWPITDGLRW